MDSSNEMSEDASDLESIHLEDSKYLVSHEQPRTDLATDCPNNSQNTNGVRVVKILTKLSVNHEAEETHTMQTTEARSHAPGADRTSTATTFRNKKTPASVALQECKQDVIAINKVVASLLQTTVNLGQKLETLEAEMKEEASQSKDAEAQIELSKRSPIGRQMARKSNWPPGTKKHAL